MEFVVILFGWYVVVCLSALIATCKGRNGFHWALVAVPLGGIALFIVCCLPFQAPGQGSGPRQRTVPTPKPAKKPAKQPPTAPLGLGG